MRKATTLASLLVTILAAAPASALPITSWRQITSNGPTNVATQLWADVSDAGSNLVAFRFENRGAVASSITDIYFDDAVPLMFSSIYSIADSGTGVDFSAGARPSNLPGGHSIGFSATYSADSNRPTSDNGIGNSTLIPGAEWVTITFALNSGRTFDELVSRLASEDFRIGMHVQAIGTAGESESYVSSVPEPATLLMLGAGLVLVAARIRRR